MMNVQQPCGRIVHIVSVSRYLYRVFCGAEEWTEQPVPYIDARDLAYEAVPKRTPSLHRYYDRASWEVYWSVYGPRPWHLCTFSPHIYGKEAAERHAERLFTLVAGRGMPFNRAVSVVLRDYPKGSPQNP